MRRRLNPALMSNSILMSAMATEKDILPDGQKIVGIREFISGADYLNKGDAFWPGIIEDLEEMNAEGIIGAIIEQGIGGGKSYRFSAMICYQLYKLKMLEMLGQDLRQSVGMDKDMSIDIVNVSVTAQQAKDVVFGYVAKFIEKSPWFLEYMRPDKNIKSRLRFEGFNVFPGHSKDTSVIGRNIHTALFDEANFFERLSNDPDKEHLASVLFDAISSRIRSRFGLHGFLGICSSRKIVSDFTRLKIEALKQSDLADAFYMPDARPVWELWTDERKASEQWRSFVVDSMEWDSAGQSFDSIEGGRTILSGSVWVPKRYWGDFDSNPEASLRDHASKPADAFSPFFRRTSAIVPDFGDEDVSGLQNPIRVGVKPSDWTEPVDSRSELFDSLFSPDFVGQPGVLYHFHVDPAKNKDGRGDAAGLSIAYVSGQIEATDHDTENLRDKGLSNTYALTVDVPLLLQIRAAKGREIELQLFRELLIFLRDERGFAFGRSSYDGWESLDARQQMNRKGFRVEHLSVDKNREPYQTLKTLLYDGRLFFPIARGQTRDTSREQLRILARQGDSCAIVQVEMMELEDIKGQKIDHPAKGSKDVADAMCGAVYNAISARMPKKKRKRT